MNEWVITAPISSHSTSQPSNSNRPKNYTVIYNDTLSRISLGGRSTSCFLSCAQDHKLL